MSKEREFLEKFWGEGKKVQEFDAFTALPPYYDALMEKIPYHAWLDYLEDLLKRLDSNFVFQRILELACGTGNLAIELARRGYEVVGIDIVEGMVKIAWEKAFDAKLDGQVNFYVQDISRLNLPNEPAFDLAICLFDSLNYITDPKQMYQVFSKTLQHVRKGGYFVFDLNSDYALKENFFDQDNMDEDESLTKVYYLWRSRYDELTRICSVEMWFAVKDEFGNWRRFKEIHRQFAYRIEEIQDIAKASGWEWVKVLDAFTFYPPDEKSERWYFVLQHPN